MISTFYFYLLLGFLIELRYLDILINILELRYPGILFINSGTPEGDKDYDVDKDKNPFKIPLLPKRKASELDKKPELPQQELEQDEDEDDETGENLNDLSRALKQVRKARILDRRLPDHQKHSNHHLKDIKEEFSSYFDEESGNDIAKGLEQIEGMLKEEISSYMKEKEKLAQQQQQQQEQEQQLYNKPPLEQEQEQNNPPLKKQKGKDLLEDIPVEMPSFMDDLD